MTTFITLLALLACTPDVTKEEVKRLVAAGVSDDIVVEFIRSHAPAPVLSGDDLIELRNARVSEKVIAAMIEASAVPRSEQIVPRSTYGGGWYYPNDYCYDYGFGPFFWWYFGPSYTWYYHYGYRYPWYVHRYPYSYRYPYGYRWTYPYGYRYPYVRPWGPYWNYPPRTYVHPGPTPTPRPSYVPHSTPRDGGKH